MKTYLMISSALALGFPVLVEASQKLPAASSGSGANETTEWSGSALQPADQGISTVDLVTTRDINQEVSRASGISASGREVRVATYRGRVVLRGTVSSAEEKRRLEEIAARRAGAENVQSELELKVGKE